MLRRLLMSPIVRSATYFVLVSACIALTVWLVPPVRGLVMSVVRTDVSGDVFQRALEPPVGVTRPESLVVRAGLAVLLLIAALIFVAPIAWMYMLTKRQEGYDKTFVQVLFMLPVVVAVVVRVVRGDLALAFALAGIVAAVRFRTTLRDLKNAVYAFAAIGIGLPPGRARGSSP